VREKAESAEPIVERHDDGSLLRERGAIVALLSAEARKETTAVNPHEYGTRGAGRRKRERARPDVEVEAVLRNAGGERIDVAVRLVLDAVVSELSCGAHTSPVRGGLRRPPPKRTDGRCRVGNTAEHGYPAGRIDDPFKCAGIDRDARRVNARGADESGENCADNYSEPESWRSHLCLPSGS
jgi:hypothetical protein